jgi:hypothetical protein
MGPECVTCFTSPFWRLQCWSRVQFFSEAGECVCTLVLKYSNITRNKCMGNEGAKKSVIRSRIVETDWVVRLKASTELTDKCHTVYSNRLHAWWWYKAGTLIIILNFKAKLSQRKTDSHASFIVRDHKACLVITMHFTLTHPSQTMYKLCYKPVNTNIFLVDSKASRGYNFLVNITKIKENFSTLIHHHAMKACGGVT